MGIPTDVSVTDRSPRLGEEEGVAYNFVTPTLFDAAIEDGRMKQYVTFGSRRYLAHSLQEYCLGGSREAVCAILSTQTASHPAAETVFC